MIDGMRNGICRKTLAFVLVLSCIAPYYAIGSERDPVALLQDYLRIDTTNPPGNEVLATNFLAAILSAEGIAYETAESAPGRVNLWARIDGGDKPGLLLLHHTDTVPADSAAWTTPPLGGELRDGYVYGRGALDMKSQGIMHLLTFIALHRSGRSLNRDVVFMATADEENGSAMGMGWMIANRPDAFRDIGLTNYRGRWRRCHQRTEVLRRGGSAEVPPMVSNRSNGHTGSRIHPS